MDPTEFEASLGQMRRTDEVWRQMVTFARERQVRHLGYHHLPPPGAPDAQLLRIENDGFADALLAWYVAARLTGMAVMAAFTLNSVEPVYLDEFERRPGLTQAERDHLAFYRALGVVSGLTLQVFGLNGRNGIFAIQLEDHIVRLDPVAMNTLRWACQLMHLRYCVLVLPTLGKLPSLSAREAEVLAWVARGKSNGAIGEILGISAHTVDAHLRRIYLKLGVFDRISAALRGLGFGLIRLDA